jgi:hypothetical protein
MPNFFPLKAFSGDYFALVDLFWALLLTDRGNIGVILGVILFWGSFFGSLYLYYGVIRGNITVILPYPPCPYKGRGKVICNSISRGIRIVKEKGTWLMGVR